MSKLMNFLKTRVIIEFLLVAIWLVCSSGCSGTDMVVKEDGNGKLLNQAVSKINDKKRAGKLLAQALSKYPKEAYVVTVGKPEIIETDTATNEAKIEIPLTISWNKSFINELASTLAQISIDHFSWQSFDSFNSYQMLKQSEGKKVILTCLGTVSNIKNGRTATCEAIDSNILNEAKASLVSTVQTIYDINRSPLSLNISFKDKHGNILNTAAYTFNYEDNMDYPERHGIDPFKFGDNTYVSMPNILWELNYTYWARRLIVTDGVFKMKALVTADINSLDNVSSVTAKFDEWQAK